MDEICPLTMIISIVLTPATISPQIRLVLTFKSPKSGEDSYGIKKLFIFSKKDEKSVTGWKVCMIVNHLKIIKSEASSFIVKFSISSNRYSSKQ
jgi:hypothetical protein